jgi:hypothetical protein
MVAFAISFPMNPRRSLLTSVPRLCGALLLASLAPGAVLAYDSPDFSAELFAADGILLAEDERSSLLGALAAIASNFPNNTRVDDDLREKALAVALQLDPLHHASRTAHRELRLWATPKPVPGFDSLASVSEILWSIGKRLAEPPLDPEERRLAPLLLELSLVTHPKPPDDRLAEFAAIAGRELLPWEKAVRLQRESNPTTARAQDLFATAQEASRERRRAIAVSEKPSRVPPGVPIAASAAGATITPSAPVPRPPRIEPVSASLLAVREVVAVESGPVAGRVTLTLRDPRGTRERLYLTEAGPAVSYPIGPSDDAIPIDPFSVPAAAAGKNWVWPAGAIGEVRFEPDTAPDAPRQLLRVGAVLPSLVLLESLLGKKATNETFVLIGEIDAETMGVELPGDPIRTIEVAAATGRAHVLAPDSVFEPLVTYLQISQRLDLLLQSELIGYKDLAGAVARMTTTDDPALTSASTEFAKMKWILINEVSKGLALTDLLRIPSAQDKLRGILAQCPDHLSARAMLEFGTRPLTAEILRSRFVAEVDAVVQPFTRFEDSTTDATTLLGRVEDASTQFLRFRAQTPLEARDLLGAAVDLVEAVELYLQITNKGSSIGQQRLREAIAAVSRYEAERTKLKVP